MTNYVPSIPDCDRWKKYVSNLAKHRVGSKLNTYVSSDSPLGEIKIISPVGGDLDIVKKKARQYKKKAKQNSFQTTQRSDSGKTSTKGKSTRGKSDKKQTKSGRKTPTTKKVKKPASNKRNMGKKGAKQKRKQKNKK